MEVIKVKWAERTIFKNETNDYTVSLYKPADAKRGCIICTGISLPETKGVTFTFEGEYKETPRGRQFQVTSFTADLQQDEDGIISFLSSGTIKGIGKVLAKRIYDTFGDQTFAVLRTTPERLGKVKGVSGAKLRKIMAGLKEVFSNFDVYDFLRSHNCTWATPAMAAKIITEVQAQNEKKSEKEQKDDPIELITKDPYWLLRIHGIDFFAADQLAKSLGFAMDSEERFRAASLYVLMQQELSGHCSMDLQAFGFALFNLMKAPGIDPAKINAGTCNLVSLPYPPIKYKTLRTSDGTNFKCIYRATTYDAEREVYDNIIRFSKNPETPISVNFELILSDIEKSQGVTLSDSQRRAVQTAIESPISIITGCPGTGKTTVLKAIAKYYERTHRNARILMLAPTGRAARRMTESTGYPASTIHSRLMLLGDADGCNGNNLKYIDENLMIVDETSMLDIFVARHLLANTSLSTKIVFVGDIDQLPSVSAGSFLRDLVTSDVVPCVTLDTVFRQGMGSILTNARKIHNGDTDLVTDEHFEIHDHLMGEQLENEMLASYLDAVRQYGIHNVVCLCPVKDYAAGVNAMNKRIQAVVNPASPDKAEVSYCGTVYREGDLVMELKNGPDVMNGDIGTITSIVEKAKDEESGKKEIEIEVHFGEEDTDDMVSVVYEKSELDELALAYAMTVHKSQGSEYSCVITCLQDINKKMQARNLIYTAITRAKTDVKFFGSRNALNNAIRHDVSNERRTLLGHYLRLASGKVWEYRNSSTPF